MENVDNSFESELVVSLGLAKDLSNVYGYETEYINTDTAKRIRFITVGKNDNFKKAVDEAVEKVRVANGMPEGMKPIIHAVVKDPKGLLEKNQFKSNSKNKSPKYGSVSQTPNGGDNYYWIYSNRYYVWEKGEFDDSFGGGHWKILSASRSGTTLDYDDSAFYRFLGGMTDHPPRAGKYEGECVNYFASVYMDEEADTYTNTNRPSYGTVVTEDPRYIYEGGGWGWDRKVAKWTWKTDEVAEEGWHEPHQWSHSGWGYTLSGGDEFAAPYLSQPERKGSYEGEEVYKGVWVWVEK